MSVEEWRPVLGWEGLYEVSDFGRVRSLDRKVICINRGKEVTYTVYGRVLSPGTVQGYKQVALQCAPRHEQKKVHQLVLEAFVGPCPTGHECRHLKGNREDNRLLMLSWGTKLENAQDKHRHGTMCEGEKHGNAKVTSSDVLEIRRRWANGERQVDLAAEFNIGQGRISAIVRRATWKKVA